MQNITPIPPDKLAPNYASRLNDLLNESGAPAGRPEGMIYSASAVPQQAPQQPIINQAPTPNPQISVNPASIPTTQRYAAQAIANQPAMMPTAIPPRAPQQMTLSAAVQGAAAPSAPAVGSTATLPGQAPLPNAAAMAGVPNMQPNTMPMAAQMPTQPVQMPVQAAQVPQAPVAQAPTQMPTQPVQMPVQAPTQPVQAPAMPTQSVAAPASTPTPAQMPAQPTQAPAQQAQMPVQTAQLPQAPAAQAPAPQTPAAQAPAQTPQAPATQAAPAPAEPTQATMHPIADLSTNKNKLAPKNPLNTMSQEMIQQIVKATKVNTVLDDDEVVETIKPAYITELEQDLSADMHAEDGVQNKIAMQMSNELKDDELTIAASKIEQPKVVEVAQPEPEVELPEALQAALNDVSSENPNINFATEEEIAEKEAELAAEEAEKEAAQKDENNVNLVQGEDEETDEAPKNTIGDGLGATGPQMAAS